MWSGIAAFRLGYGWLDWAVRVQSVTWGRVDFTLCSQCQALGQALILCRQGRGDIDGWCCLVVTLPCGYCLKASMTVKDGPGVHRFHPHL